MDQPVVGYVRCDIGALLAKKVCLGKRSRGLRKKQSLSCSRCAIDGHEVEPGCQTPLLDCTRRVPRLQFRLFFATFVLHVLPTLRRSQYGRRLIAPRRAALLIEGCERQAVS